MGWTLSEWLRRYWVEVCWCAFVLVNSVGILEFGEWATVPFHFIWIGLSLLYGWRVWSLRATSAALAVVVLVSGVTMAADVLTGTQAPDELTEIPLMSIVFVVMVWYVRRHLAAREETRRIAEYNLRLVEEEERFIQDTSHVIRTPLTIALGHAEMLRRTTRDPAALHASQIVIEELTRLKKTTDRLLALAHSGQPAFLLAAPTSVRTLLESAVTLWSDRHPSVRLGPVEDVTVPMDPDRMLDVLNELIGNAIEHTPPGTPVEVSARVEEGRPVLVVADRGPGIPEADHVRIFDRFARAGTYGYTQRFGLGLAIVKATMEAHGGSALVRTGAGGGAVFELRLPVPAVPPPDPAPDASVERVG